MTENPFFIIESRLDRLESILLNIQANQSQEKKAPLTKAELMTVQEAAAFLNLAKATIYSKVQKGELPHSRKGRKLYFSEQELTDWVKSGHQKTNAEIEAEVWSSASAKKRNLLRAA